MELLQRLNRNGMTVIMVTHSVECSEYAERILRLCDGRLVEGDDSVNMIDVKNRAPRLETKVA